NPIHTRPKKQMNGLKNAFIPHLKKWAFRGQKRKAALIEQVKGQCEKQLKQQEEQNRTLQKQLKEITDSHKIASEKSNAQIAILQKQLNNIIVSNTEKDKKNNEQAKILSDQIKKLTDTQLERDKSSSIQIDQLSKQLTTSQVRIDNLLRSIADKDAKIAELSNKRSGCLGVVAGFAGILILFLAFL
ncbi:hypothetical protein D0T87_15500, partial [Bacteroides sp. 51]|nr:hypothetical protein [Bacteroides sp. 51]